MASGRLVTVLISPAVMVCGTTRLPKVELTVAARNVSSAAGLIGIEKAPAPRKEPR